MNSNRDCTSYGTVCPLRGSLGVSSPVYLFIRSITQGLSKAEYRLFCHLLASTFNSFRNIKENNDGWIKIPKRFIQDKFRTAVPKRLQDLGLIHIDKQYFPGKASRQYKVQDWVIDKYVSLSHQAVTTEQQTWVNLLNGKQPGALHAKPTKKAEIIPALIQSAIDCFQVCYYNRPKVIEHLDNLKAAYEQNPSESNRFRYLNDFLCFEAINWVSQPVSKWQDIYSFNPTYTLLNTGRISTPLQSASRAMKRAAYASIPNTFNYDLSSCQATICLAEMRKQGLDCPWLEEYLTDKNKRSEYAAQLGVSEDAWKKCFLTVLMGGSLPTSLAWGDKTSIVQTLQGELDKLGKGAVKEALKRLRQILKPLLKPLQQWHKMVTQETQRKGYIINAVGIRREYESFVKKNKSAGIIAHILQGMETFFIHTLTTLADKYGFVPIGNEHDGLITLGQISNEAIEEAKKLTDLFCLELREKPFCS